MNIWQAVVLAVVEGLTEYLPVSSTGHLVITSFFMGIQENQFVKDYTVIVQFGAILSVLVLYWRRFMVSVEFYRKLFIAFLPAAIIGFMVKNKIDALLGEVSVVAWSLVIGGIILIIADSVYEKKIARSRTLKTSTDQITTREALVVGFAQCIAMVPGVSRSAASIIGGMAQKFDRKTAAEFSFFLAVPTLTAATAYKLLKIAPHIQKDQIWILFVGNVISFIVGAITIKTFITFLSHKGFRVFGYYRIMVGLVLLGLLFSGYSVADI